MFRPEIVEFPKPKQQQTKTRLAIFPMLSCYDFISFLYIPYSVNYNDDGRSDATTSPPNEIIDTKQKARKIMKTASKF